MRPPRILLVNWRDIRNPEAGGAEVHLHEVARRLAAQGFECVQYSHAWPGAQAEDVVDGVRIQRRGNRWLFNVTVWFNVRRWIRLHRSEVVLDDSNKIPFFLPWLSPVPVVAQIHHLFGRVLFKETALPMALYVLFFERLMPYCYRNTPVTTGSDSARKELLSKGFRRVSLAPEGADLVAYRVLPGEKKIPNSIVYVGRIKRYKGLDTILKAFARVRRELSDAVLWIAGSGDDVPRLKALAERLAIADAVSFRGFVSEEEKVLLYNRAEVAVNSSLKEGWGLTSIEANACGTPVVATDVPGLCDSVRDGVTGLLVPFGDDIAFADAMFRLLRDSALAQRMRSEGLSWAQAHTWEPAYLETRRLIMEVSRGGEVDSGTDSDRLPGKTLAGRSMGRQD